uniref:Uncharacterized protein n=1 Tax=Anguilla anguilla TaxID=7936 RepID=A0A0E9TTD7_ANGAN
MYYYEQAVLRDIAPCY